MKPNIVKIKFSFWKRIKILLGVPVRLILHGQEVNTLEMKDGDLWIDTSSVQNTSEDKNG